MAHGQLSSLVNLSDPGRIWLDVQRTMCMNRQSPDMPAVRLVFQKVQSLYDGRVPGYQPCKLLYHDFKHATDAFLATSRLLHGAEISGYPVDPRTATLALMAALLHNTGYFLATDDQTGTGAKYMATHHERSIAYTQALFAALAFPQEDAELMAVLLRCTGSNPNLNDMAFPSAQVALLGRILVTADLLGQMSDRGYLEKLLFLFAELQEAGNTTYPSELALLERTVTFYAVTHKRFGMDLGNAANFAQLHFRDRWHIDRDLYGEAIKRQILYLQALLAKHRFDYRDHMRRHDLIKLLSRQPHPNHVTATKSPVAP